MTIAFDVYGTLIDTHGIVSTLEAMIGSQANKFSLTWRDKQLEYSFRRGLMQNYASFAVCTRHALDYTCELYKVSLTQEQKDQLLSNYSSLPAFADVEDGLKKLAGKHHRMFAFSNGAADAVDSLMVKAGIREYFQGIISVDDIKTFKPNPAVYKYFLSESGANESEAWLVSSNPFDVIGAISAGLRAAWLKRSTNALMDPWEIEPTIIIKSLDELHETLPND